jgi:hypothetical protein
LILLLPFPAVYRPRSAVVEVEDAAFVEFGVDEGLGPFYLNPKMPRERDRVDQEIRIFAFDRKRLG